MEELDLKDFETRVVLRNLTADDYRAVVDLQLLCFPGMEPWTRAQFESQVTAFPEGQFGIEYEGRLVGSSSSLIVDASDHADWHDWHSVASGGSIDNHEPEGDTLYGIEIQVHPEFRGMRLARRLYDARKQLCRQRNIARMVVGGRIPGFARVQEEMSAQEYVEAVQQKRLYDPVLTAQIANGFVLKQLIEDYLPSDEDSAGWATHLEWFNLFYRSPRRTGRGRRATHRVRVAVVQYPMRRIDRYEDFASQIEFFVDTAADYRSDFVLFPELFTLQLLCLVENVRPGLAARQLAEYTPQYLELFRDLAVTYNVNIIGGSQFTVEDERLFNIAYLFRRNGTLGKQYKLHVTPSEKHWWGVEGGEDVEVFDTDRGKVAIALCYDIEFPEVGRIAAHRGARILFVPYNTNDRYGHLRVKLCAQARCIENHLYVVTAGAVGHLPRVENADIHYAQSGVYTPADIPFARDGIAAEASTNLEAVLVHDVDTEVLRRHRRTGTTRNWDDRRRDLYTVRWRGPQGDEDI